ncbi:hypothetical protein OIH33_12670, partial [Lactococcus petauri]|nr:hypothetical protein [Lactococcus petauri]
MVEKVFPENFYLLDFKIFDNTTIEYDIDRLKLYSECLTDNQISELSNNEYEMNYYLDGKTFKYYGV